MWQVSFSFHGSFHAKWKNLNKYIYISVVIYFHSYDKCKGLKNSLLAPVFVVSVRFGDLSRLINLWYVLYGTDCWTTFIFYIQFMNDTSE